MIVIGERENVFHHLPEVEQFDSWQEFIGRHPPLPVLL
jgi:hypothetical protein